MANQGLTQLTALASATSANGTARNGATLGTTTVERGSLYALCVGTITTASVVATYKWQTSRDGTNWDEVKMPNNAASVTIAGGGGSPLAHRVHLDCPASVASAPYARVNATLSGAATDPADLTAVIMYWAIQGSNF